MTRTLRTSMGPSAVHGWKSGFLIRGYRNSALATAPDVPVAFAVCTVDLPRPPAPPEPLWRRDAALLAAIFLTAAILLAGVVPLWLDEILQLLDTRQPSATELLKLMPHHHPGSAPLGYLAQQALGQVAGYSERIARLPSAVFGAGSVYLVVLLAARLRLRRPWVAGMLFALFPLVLRYGTEARAYSQALFFATAATVIFTSGRRGWRAVALYAGALSAAVYSQPYAIFIGVAHAVWALREGSRRTVAFGGLALAAAAFLPWYWTARSTWAVVLPAGGVQFSASWKTPFMIVRELMGAGYWGTGLALVLAAIALYRSRGATRRLMVWCLAVPVLGAVAADALFGYFLAARQYLWVLPALAVLAAAALEERRWWPAGALLLAVSLGYDWKWFHADHEDWGAAASAIEAQVDRGGCWESAPPDQARLYEYFQPALGVGHCRGRNVVVAVSRYATTDDRLAAISRLFAAGYHYDRERSVGGARLIWLSR